MSDSWPGLSTNEISLMISVSPPHLLHLPSFARCEVVNASGSGQLLHFIRVVDAYPSLIEMPRLISSE